MAKGKPGKIGPDNAGEVLAEIMTMDAARDPYVTKFRRFVLKDTLLSEDGAGDLLDKLQRASSRAELHYGSLWQMRASFQGPWMRANAQASWIALHDLMARVEKDGMDRLSADDGLDLILGVCDLLMEVYGWTRRDAAYFLLTGKKPAAFNIRYGYIERGAFPRASTFLFEVSIRCTPQQLREKYNQLRRMIKNARYRSLDPRSTELALFAAQHNDGRTWGDLMEAWNQSRPADRYKPESLRRFTRDCREAYRRVTGTPLNWQNADQRSAGFYPPREQSIKVIHEGGHNNG